MTADELIAQLRALPPDTQVLVEGYENGFDEIVELKAQDVMRYRHAQPWDGQYQPPERFEKPAAGFMQAAVILGRRGPLRKEKPMSQRKRYNLTHLVAQCNSAAPISDELKDWDQAPSVGLEQTIMDGQADIGDVILQFRERLADDYDVIQLILFGSRPRGDCHSESDVDVAVILPGEPGDFVETKLEMARRAFDVLVQTGVRIQPFPIWEHEWRNPAKYYDPELLANIAREGLIIWSFNR